ncbi:hypothetical protein QYC27_03645 [Thermosynechococcus sp. PP45]|uniref:hypothetical protein n=1 Tax=unclassified Thermosynechococcus TaxID=2622553 RepID=UPI0026720D0B|nr:MULTISPECIES: hypothetical protein [unclassified Thermosynechococcus]WKT81903.1 hypothetical protein QYC27_03645 [Thermosynechococcus sp. PP45]WNC25516.1 hypothetical protein RHH26_03645 [Thermosynechococcus sp. PP551]WNC28095.1 hypothetical protein RHH27_03645 [Thermosynechococcus sp. PP555]
MRGSLLFASALAIVCTVGTAYAESATPSANNLSNSPSTGTPISTPTWTVPARPQNITIKQPSPKRLPTEPPPIEEYSPNRTQEILCHPPKVWNPTLQSCVSLDSPTSSEPSSTAQRNKKPNHTGRPKDRPCQYDDKGRITNAPCKDKDGQQYWP